MSAKRLIPEKELKACYGLLFADYPDVVTVRQLQTMLVSAVMRRMICWEKGKSEPSNWATPTRFPKSTSSAIC